MFDIGSSELETQQQCRIRQCIISKTFKEAKIYLQFCLNPKRAFVVGINPCAVLGEHFFHADIGMVNGILAHCRGSNAPYKN